MSACDDCLKRAALVGILAPRIAELSRRRGEGVRLLLALTDADLVEAVCPGRSGSVLAKLEAFEPDAMRADVAAASLVTICIHERLYPTALRDLDDPPQTLFVRGSSEALVATAHTPAVAVVGGRRASTHALEEARELGRALAATGVPVISGLALGIDGAAHEGALAGGGRPVAVLATGADVPYPRRHRGLYERVVGAGGAVISELPPGTAARRWAFPARNRIMAALARMVVVVEAAERSGTLITAAFATALGREVGAVPGRVNVRLSAGSNQLIAEGAAVVLGPDDVLDRIFHVGARPAPPVVRLGPADSAVLDLVEAGDPPFFAPDLAVKTVRAALGRLEMLGLVRRDGLGGYERTGKRCQRA